MYRITYDGEPVGESFASLTNAQKYVYHLWTKRRTATSPKYAIEETANILDPERKGRIRKERLAQIKPLYEAGPGQPSFWLGEFSGAGTIWITIREATGEYIAVVTTRSNTGKMKWFGNANATTLSNVKKLAVEMLEKAIEAKLLSIEVGGKLKTGRII